ncbi:hypothetical protein [Thalassotalea profundi]|uniref:Secreted protein n=1 Tax=Thalassotalea profundi TaxID=2036687 RepID=A0ABQ3ILW5_9GAMM|nr:hypothetical protein [Thalassotalea profundi]GHE88167.1 hypothetical protein GCM10011501_16940 [Thalassotalea profundi]
MFKAVTNIWIITVMIVVFIGQAMAYNASIPCETSDEIHSTSIYSELIIYNDSHIGNSEDCCGIECCDIGCSCVANACTSIVFINTEIATTNLSVLSESIYTQLSEQPKTIDTPHYRPPIFIS